MIQILIAERQAIVRAGLKHIIAKTADIAVAAEAPQGSAVLELLRTRQFDLLLLGTGMPDFSGIDLIHRIQISWPALPILILSADKAARPAFEAVRAGAAGYITMHADSRLLLSAMRKLASGGRFIDPQLVDALVFEPGFSDAPPRELLSDREFQVLQMLASGKRINEIAESLALSAKTVSTHKMRLTQKLRIRNGSELIQYSIRHGLVAQ